ncbi:MAG: GNAT family N-acetyltransferase, partial [Chloroflexota bacterium]|nr:GNAT family N-acetyltransferase [Chloroflexota bacterium]
ARGLGVSGRLLETVLNHARSLDGLLRVHLTVVRTNLVAARSYERAGFVRYGRMPRAEIVNGEPVDNDLMVLMLDGYRSP